MDASRIDDDPLAALARELERLSAAHLALSEAAEDLGRVVPSVGARLDEAAQRSRAAAREAAAASARVAAT